MTARAYYYSMNTVNRRRFTRLSFEAQGTISHGNDTVNFDLTDISLKGASIHVPDSQAAARVMNFRDLELRLHLPGNGPDVEAMAVPVHKSGNDFGLEFTLIDIDSITLLRRLLELNTGSPEMVESELRKLASED
ncbi:PilZ domain-containing protein [Spirochaeta dissipatitropha]